jgi:hypothetical protein
MYFSFSKLTLEKILVLWTFRSKTGTNQNIDVLPGRTVYLLASAFNHVIVSRMNVNTGTRFFVDIS